MRKTTGDQLLEIPEVIDEINRHRWFQSEKAGKDVGFEQAAKDWILRYSKNWIEYNMAPTQEEKTKTKTTRKTKPTAIRKTKVKKNKKVVKKTKASLKKTKVSPKTKGKRRAKSYR